MGVCITQRQRLGRSPDAEPQKLQTKLCQSPGGALFEKTVNNQTQIPRRLLSPLEANQRKCSHQLFCIKPGFWCCSTGSEVGCLAGKVDEEGACIFAFSCKFCFQNCSDNRNIFKISAKTKDYIGRN